jgi:hypothetical protein
MDIERAIKISSANYQHLEGELASLLSFAANAKKQKPHSKWISKFVPISHPKVKGGEQRRKKKKEKKRKTQKRERRKKRERKKRRGQKRNVFKNAFFSA